MADPVRIYGPTGAIVGFVDPDTGKASASGTIGINGIKVRKGQRVENAREVANTPKPDSRRKAAPARPGDPPAGTKSTGSWNGRGAPPSKQAAIEWMVANGVAKGEAVRGSYDREGWGRRAREAVKTSQEYKKRKDKKDGKDDKEGKKEPTPKEVADAAVVDSEFSGDDKPTVGGSRGAPVLPYELPADFDPMERGGGLTFENRGRNADVGRSWKSNPLAEGGRYNPRDVVRPRYFEKNLLDPTKWSPEKVSDLQKVLLDIGLYGKKKIKLGTYTGADMNVFKVLLASANIEGRTWQQQLAEWRKRPPLEIIEDLVGDEEEKRLPTIEVSNPVDIRTQAESVSQELLGRVDRGFAEGSVPGYQAAQAGPQWGVYNDQEAGGGGTVTQAPNMAAYLQDTLRRQKPLEVDGYAFVGAFDSFMRMIGAN